MPRRTARVIGILADFAGHSELARESMSERRALTIDSADGAGAMRRIAPSLELVVPCTLTEDRISIRVELHFGALSDFDPAAIVHQVGPVQRLAQVRRSLAEALAAPWPPSEVGKPASSDSVSRPVNLRRRRPASPGRGATWSRSHTPLDEIVDQMPVIDLALRKAAARTDTTESLRGTTPSEMGARIRELDALIKAQVDVVTSHPEFLALSNTWRWLCDVADSASASESIRWFQISQDELVQSNAGSTRNVLARPFASVLGQLFGSDLSSGAKHLLLLSPTLAEGDRGDDVRRLIESVGAALGIEAQIGDDSE